MHLEWAELGLAVWTKLGGAPDGKTQTFFGCHCPRTQFVTSDVNVSFAVGINKHRLFEKIEAVLSAKP